MKKNNNNLYNALTLIKNKGCCNYTIERAYRQLSLVIEQITNEEANCIYAALWEIDVLNPDQILDSSRARRNLAYIINYILNKYCKTDFPTYDRLPEANSHFIIETDYIRHLQRLKLLEQLKIRGDR